MIKRWKKPTGVRVSPVTNRDAVARDNDRALKQCAAMSDQERRQVIRKLQNLISGICG